MDYLCIDSVSSCKIFDYFITYKLSDDEGVHGEIRNKISCTHFRKFYNYSISVFACMTLLDASKVTTAWRYRNSIIIIIITLRAS